MSPKIPFVAVCLTLASILVHGCQDNAAPNATPAPTREEVPPAAATAQPEDAPAPTEAPPADAATAQPAPEVKPPVTGRSAGGPGALRRVEAPDFDKVPEGVTVLALIRPAESNSVHVDTLAADSVIVETENVGRIRFDRRALRLPADRSTVLRIDEQVIEWTRDVPIVELQRSRNGAWNIVKSSDR